MGVVGDLELVLDDDDLAGGLVVTDHVEAEVAHRMLGTLEHEIHPEEVREDVDVVEQPWREVECFVGPDVPRPHDLQPAQ